MIDTSNLTNYDYYLITLENGKKEKSQFVNGVFKLVSSGDIYGSSVIKCETLTNFDPENDFEQKPQYAGDLEKGESAENMIICPYCKYEIELDGEEFREYDGEEYECPNCAHKFIVSCHPVFEFFTLQNCEVNGLNHKFTTNPKIVYGAGKEVPGADCKRLFYNVCLECGEGRYLPMEEEAKKFDDMMGNPMEKLNNLTKN